MPMNVAEREYAAQFREIATHAQKPSTPNFLGTIRNERPNCVLLRLSASTPERVWPRPACSVWASYAASVRSRNWRRKAGIEFSDHTRLTCCCKFSTFASEIGRASGREEG